MAYYFIASHHDHSLEDWPYGCIVHVLTHARKHLANKQPRCPGYTTQSRYPLTIASTEIDAFINGHTWSLRGGWCGTMRTQALTKTIFVKTTQSSLWKFALNSTGTLYVRCITFFVCSAVGHREKAANGYTLWVYIHKYMNMCYYIVSM